MSIVRDTSVDGIGWRDSVYCAGCAHHCEGCHNQETWDFQAGTNRSVEEIAEELSHSENNVTFTGGDPMFQPKAFTELAKLIHAQGKGIWLYTGFTFEQCCAHPDRYALLEQCDVLVDGKFVLAKKNLDLLFRGSSNQRLIDVKKSLVDGNVVLLDYDPKPKF